MAYTALYRKFRPLRFDDMVGQEAITRTLKNQIIAGRTGHAYLFNGGRGTGKTTSAKILARAVNCLNPKDGEPCNECEICKAALAGSLTDIVEMDAASNNSVDDIRSIRDEVNFLPTLAKYRVYIIDEVHMLSTGAFNALLKTLEEPPEHVKFILATTEPQKLPATILSRCQRFDFKKISNEDIAKRLKYVAKESNIEITEDAIRLISVLAEGAMRDALSILERCIQDGNNEIKIDLVKDLVGMPKLEFISKITSAIFDYNLEQALENLNIVLEQGKDVTNLIWELIKYIKDILVYKTSKKLDLYSNEEIKEIDELAEKISKERLLKIIYDLSECENNIKWSSQKSLMLQVEIIKLCSKENNITSNAGLEDINNKINMLEEKINDIGNIDFSKIDKKQEDSSNKNITINRSVEKKAETKKIDTSKIKGLDFWPKVIDDLKKSGKILVATNLLNTKLIEINDMTIGIIFSNGLTPFVKTVLEKPENHTELVRLISTECGKTMQIKLLDNNDNIVKKKAEESALSEATKDLDISINIIDE
ncbi:MAG: DNA polymerase III subunit gamma/tau [Clostridia bacterium]